MTRRMTKEEYPLINRYIVKSKDITELINDIEYTHTYPVIMEEFTFPTGEILDIPSVLNRFIINKYRLKSYNTIRNINITIAQFMNFVRIQVASGEDEGFDILKKKGLCALDFYQLATFLNYGALCGDSYNTFMQKKNRLFEFYKRLKSHSVINVKWKTTTVYNEENKRVVVYEYPYNRTEFQLSVPSKFKNQVEKEKDLSDYEIELLLKLCKRYYPEIHFGVALCIYGGLRQGELVNLRFSDVRLYDDENIMMVNIKDRQALLFKDRDIAASGVKRKRRQVVFNDDGLLYEYYENHKKLRTSIIEKRGIKTPALLLDRNGNAMTGLTYLQKFYKLKQRFLEHIELEDYNRYIELVESKWGGHICRGIFTNLCLRRGYAKSLDELMHVRGDTSKTSSKPYWNSRSIVRTTQRVTDILTSCDKYKDDLDFKGVDIYE